MQIICPRCSSNDVRLLSMVYAANTSHSTINIDGKYSSSTNTTSLGMRAAPPSPPHSNIFIIVRAILVWMIVTVITSALKWRLLGITFFCLYLPIFLFFRLRANNKYKRKYRQLSRQWSNSFMCQRCGAILIDEIHAH